MTFKVMTLPLVTVALGTCMAAVAQTRVDGAAAGERRTTESVLAEIRSHLEIDREYVPGGRVELPLSLGRAARLKFAENKAGVTEFLFLYEAERLQVLYACDGELHSSTTLTRKRLRDSRTISTADAPVWMKCTSEWNAQGTKAVVTFRAEPVPEEEMRRTLEARRRREVEQLNALRRVLEWDEDSAVTPMRLVLPRQDQPELIALRTKYEIDKELAGAADDYERLQRLAKWVHERWQHAGSNTPSKPDPLTILAEAAQGKRFRCVEYAAVVAGCAQALGMPARTVGLKREDVETAKSGAGHVVAEVWLASRGKWVFVDGQWDAIPEQDGVPLNAVEFQDAIARNAPGLLIRSSSEVDANAYLRWVAAYLYYFDCHIDQDRFRTDGNGTTSQRYEPQRGMVMLCPKGAKKPAVFQGTSPIRNCTYVSNPRAFYPTPETPTSP